MAYARWGPNSDVYVYRHIRGGYECCGCPFGGPDKTMTAKKMWDHLVAHDQAGHKVPRHALASFGILRHGEPCESMDPVVAELVAMATQAGGKVLSWDADVPDWARGDMDEVERALAKEQRLADALDKTGEARDDG